MRFFQISFLFLFISNPAFSAQPFPEVQSYEQLLQAIRNVRADSQQRIESMVDQEKVRESWETGRLIHVHILQSKKPEYGEEVFKRLSSDLSTSATELYRMREFYIAYPNFVPAQNLSWSHYQSLLTLDDAKERDVIIQEAVKNRWNRDQVREEVRRRKKRAGISETPEMLQEIKPGIIHTHHIFKQDGKLKIDLGFDTYFDLPKEFKKKVKDGEIVKWNGGAPLGGAHSQGRVQDPPLQIMPDATLKDLYTYQAKVMNVVDGDTFYALIDLGFGISLHQRLRLRRLDAPEILSSDGKEAKTVLEKILARSKGPLLLKISKTDDQYGRYLADIWINGTNIDQELLDSGVFTPRGDA